jgi:transposase InsO family protein
MCQFYNVPRSSYYAWKHRESMPSKDLELVALIEECQKRHKRRYGYRRVQLWLKREKGITVNHKKVLRITEKYNLLSVIRRRRLLKYVQNGNLVYANILARDFYASRPNQKWVTDISYIQTPEGTLYLSSIRDLFDQYIVAYKTAKRQDYTLVGRTLKAALGNENPKLKVVLHSDQGTQYRSFEYHDDLSGSSLVPSMSPPHSPADNAPAENFFSIFKAECVYLEKPQTLEEAEQLTAEFIDYYNYERLQLRNGATPFETRRQWFDANLE